MSKLFLVFFSIAVLTACASHKPTHAGFIKEDTDFLHKEILLLSYAGPANLSYSGLPNYDELEVNGGAGMVYPGGTPALFLASVITHAVIVDSAKEGRRSKMQERANEVLAPYEVAINSLSYRDLVSDVVSTLSTVEKGPTIENYHTYDATAGEVKWVLESKPNFFMLQDEGAILLQNAIAVYSNVESPKIIYQNTVEVVSHAYQGDNPEEYWTSNNGEALRHLTAELVAESVKVAYHDMQPKTSTTTEKDQTFHYYQEGEKAYERGRLVAVEPDRLIIRTLRGWLKSVPRINEQTPAFEKHEDTAEAFAGARGIGVYY